MNGQLTRYISDMWGEANQTVAAGSVIALIIVSGLLVFLPGPTGEVVRAFESILLFELGFVFGLALAISVIVLGVIAVGPWGRIVLGGDDAAPAYDNATYFAMLFAVGIAAGIAFFGPGEAANYMLDLPPGIDPGASALDRGIWGVSFTLTHWGIITSATTAVFAVPIGYYYYRDDAPFRVSSALYPFVKDRPLLAGIVDVFAIAGLVFGLASSIMETIQNFLAGISFQWGVSSPEIGTVLFIIAVTLVFTLSAYTGLNRGIRRISVFSLGLFVVLSTAALAFGGTREILSISVAATAAQPAHLSALATNLGTEWVAFWHHFNTAIWFSIAAGYGLFTARISYGRSLREIVGYAVVASGFANMVWFYIVGGGVVQQAVEDGGETLALIETEGFEIAAFPLLLGFPAGELFLLLFLGIGLLFIINSADSQTMSVAMMTSTDTVNPPGMIRIFWGTTIGLIAIMLIVVGGADIVGSFAVLTGFVLAILAVVALCTTLVSMLRHRESAS